MARESLEERREHRILVERAVDHEMAFGVAIGLGEIALADAPVERLALPLHSIELRGKATRSGGLVDVEDDHEIRFASSGGHPTDREDLLGREPPGGSLVGERGGDESIREDESTRGERRADAFGHQLGPARHVQEHLATEIHLLVPRVEQHPSHRLADRRPTWFADHFGNDAVIATERRETGELGGLAGAVGTVEDDEPAGEDRTPVVHRRDYDPTRPDRQVAAVRTPGADALGRGARSTTTIAAMQVDVRSQQGERVGRIEFDPVTRPVRIRPEGCDRDVFLEWDNAVDDAGQLRACVICGDSHLYRTRTLPQVTPFVILIALAGATISLLGFANSGWVIGMLVVVLAIDVGVLLLARTRLVCYRCGSIYDDLRVAGYHGRWDPTVAERIDDGPAPVDAGERREPEGEP